MRKSFCGFLATACFLIKLFKPPSQPLPGFFGE